MRLVPRVEQVLVVLVYSAHVLLVPGTKVEESFTLHATRDVVVRGTSRLAIPHYDHAEFAGAVPRSLIPPTLLAILSTPVLDLAKRCGAIRDGLDAQIIIRLVLALTSALALLFLASRVRSTYGGRTARYLLLLSATQFHVPFWAGRTVPNMLAFPIVQVALGLFVSPPTLQALSRPRFETRRNILVGFALLTFAAIVIRLELIALIAPFALENLLQGSVGLVELAVTGTVSALLSLGASIGVDTYFWQQRETWLWPEGYAFWFNVVEGKSAEWGVSPPLYYFTSALPRLLHLSLIPAAFSFLLDRRSRRLLLPCLVYVGLLSALKHKEWRFVVYVVPAFTIAAAGGIVGLGAFTASPRLRRLALLALVGANLVLTALGLVASSQNYPGLAAVTFLRSSHLAITSDHTVAKLATVHVHVGIEAKMTGASNFVLLDQPAQARAHLENDAAPRAWYLPSLSPSTSTVTPEIVYSRLETPAFETLRGLARSGEFDYALVSAAAADDEDDEAASAPVGTETLYEAPVFAGFDWRAVLLRGKVGEVVRTKPAVRVVKLPRSDRA
ncbi:dolichyl-P-Man:Man(7)GlcNAc(2)-PP-dolichol alpha-1,6-mannosyltransferase [Rhodotorula mucilaginosa]|uniref:Mannosyltransferase n=1 Tax=Rhodotorula mucilaginosa TaxID=5537 RepID=A0A9P7B3X6_RHOMI|nr:dolichyl-P-Man:Man(7)GlcNAc(2)-PP-dolichol alpha-1,6-mannosyltransferase [Rhodotorula mucilaginosa]